MDVVIDAPLVKCFYQEGESEGATECRAEVKPLFDGLGSDHVAVLDVGGHIEQEWRAVVDHEWFNAWLSQAFEVGSIIEIEPGNHRDLLRSLSSSCGFPANTGDKWLVRVAVTRSARTGADVALVSEDVHFFHPKAGKNGKARERYLSTCGGCVAQRLAKRNVRSVTVDAFLSG